MKKIISIILFVNIFVIVYSQNKIPINNRNLIVNTVLDINKCIKWHVDFSRIKNTVNYKSYFISVGINGGLIAIDTNFRSIDQDFSDNLNTDLFTNITKRNDTLFAEKFDKIYYYQDSNNLWKEYNLNEPILLFDILFEDDKYIFFPISGGEFGSMLLIYDKNIKKLRMTSTETVARQIYNEDGVYYVVSSLFHMGGSSEYFILKNIDSINFVEYNKGLFDEIKYKLAYEFPEYFKKNFNTNFFKFIFQPKYGVILTNVVKINNKMYHFMDDNTMKYISKHIFCKVKTNITTIGNNDSLQIIDSIEKFQVRKTTQNNRFTIINGYDNGFYILKNNTLTKIDFDKTPDYYFKKGFILNHKKMNVYNGQKGTKPDYSKTFNFKLNSKYTLISIDNMELTEIYLMKNKKRINLKFSKQCRLDKCFKWKRNNFLFMKGDIGLIEIYNLKRFIEIYKKDD